MRRAAESRTTEMESAVMSGVEGNEEVVERAGEATGVEVIVGGEGGERRCL